MQMDAAINKASALVEALSYIQRFHNKVVVVKVGGSIMDNEEALTNLLTDIVFMNYVGMQPVLVHGGGKAINDAMLKAGLEPQMVQGRRYTDERTLAIAEHVLCNQINKFIVNFIQAQGCEAMGLHSLTSNVLFAEKTYLAGPDGRRLDLGFVGDVKSVNARLLQLRRDRQRHAAQGRSLQAGDPGRCCQDAHHRRPNSTRPAAGDLHRGGDWDRDRRVKMTNDEIRMTN
jgi:acetylglutamate kinase